MDNHRGLVNTTDHLTEEERQIVATVFARIKLIYGVSKYRAQFGTGDDERLAKAEWADEIVKYTPERLGLMLERAKRRQNNDTFICMNEILDNEPFNCWYEGSTQQEALGYTDKAALARAKYKAGLGFDESKCLLDYFGRKGPDGQEYSDGHPLLERD